MLSDKRLLALFKKSCFSVYSELDEALNVLCEDEAIEFARAVEDAARERERERCAKELPIWLHGFEPCYDCDHPHEPDRCIHKGSNGDKCQKAREAFILAKLKESA